MAKADEALLKKLLEDHHRWTGSLRAREILDNWAASRCQVRQGVPARVPSRSDRNGCQQKQRPPATAKIRQGQGLRRSRV
jgi:glutamate synthase (NADPH/NADH) large chain